MVSNLSICEVRSDLSVSSRSSARYVSRSICSAVSSEEERHSSVSSRYVSSSVSSNVSRNISARHISNIIAHRVVLIILVLSFDGIRRMV